MNLQEFAALKSGDKIENRMNGGTTHGTIVEATPSGVRVVWGERQERETRFFYSVQTTAWMSWSRTEICDKCGAKITVSGGAPCPTCEQT